jgi:hypothetical protein
LKEKATQASVGPTPVLPPSPQFDVTIEFCLRGSLSKRNSSRPRSAAVSPLHSGQGFSLDIGVPEDLDRAQTELAQIGQIVLLGEAS